MSRLALPATKSNLLRLRADLEFLEMGRDLLDQKREFLCEALAGLDRQARTLRRRVEEELQRAYAALAEAHAVLGEAGLDRLALAAPPIPVAPVRERSLMGVVVPVLERRDGAATDRGVPGPGSAPGEAGAAADTTAMRLCALAPGLAELAEVETGCARLARELMRTRRKLNALEVLHIPSHRETIRFIADQLEEREREALFQLKRAARARR